MYSIIDVEPGKGNHCKTEMDKHIYRVLYYTNPVLKPLTRYIMFLPVLSQKKKENKERKEKKTRKKEKIIMLQYVFDIKMLV